MELLHICLLDVFINTLLNCYKYLGIPSGSYELIYVNVCNK
jgi:hypothetical protein